MTIHPLLLENENKRLDIPLWQLLCFVMFCVWQMGIIYFIGPTLNIDGRTPLPISSDNLTLLIVAGYICSIISMIIVPKLIIWLSRISTIIALLSAIGLFFPFSNAILTILIYVQIFCCCYMIGFESATMVHYFTQKSVTEHLLIAYPIGYLLVAFIQNDFIQMNFSTFRLMMVVMIALLLVFFFKIPADAGIRFVKKSDNIVLPSRFLSGLILLSFLSALLGVIAPAAAAEFKHGVFVAYIGCALGSFFVYFLYKKTNRHPICFIPYVIGISAIGYLLLPIAYYFPSLEMITCAFIGVGMSACALIPLFALLMVKQYPSKMIVPTCIGLAMLAVIVQSLLVEAFREFIILLNFSYLVIVLILAIIFLMFEPFLIYAMQRKFSEPNIKKEDPVEMIESTPIDILSTLTKRETEIVELISFGHSNSDIAKMLFISEHTVKDHTKNIYRKLDIHSRYELMALVNQSKK